MAKGKPKSTAVPNVKVKAAIGTAALLASGASAKGLRGSGAGIDDEEAVVASFHLSGKQGLNNDDPPPNSAVAERVIAETAPFQMTTARRAKASKSPGTGNDSKKSKKKSKKKGKKKSKSKDRVRQLGMEPPEADDSESSEEEQKGWKRFRWI